MGETKFIGDLRVTGDIVAEGDVTIDGGAVFDNEAVEGNFAIGGTLDVTGTSALGDDVTVTGDVAAVAGVFSGNIEAVDGAFSGDVTVGDDLTVTGDIVGATAAIGTGGTVITKIQKGTIASVNPDEIASGAAAEITVTITGAAAGDALVINPPAALEAGLIVGSARVTDTNEAKFRIFNAAGEAVNAASATWTYILFKS